MAKLVQGFGFVDETHRHLENTEYGKAYGVELILLEFTSIVVIIVS